MSSDSTPAKTTDGTRAHTTDWTRAHIEANDEGSRLQASAVIVRRCSGELKYHPVTGLAHPPPAELAQALDALRRSLDRIAPWIEAFPEEEASLCGQGGEIQLREMSTSHRRIGEVADLLRRSIAALETTLAAPERAPLDAPYGLGAPRRPHPGAQATWVAERADALARELIYVTVLKENLLVSPTPSPGSSGHAPP